jgi:hypothetical protein
LARRFRMIQIKMLDKNICRLCWIEPNKPDAVTPRLRRGLQSCITGAGSLIRDVRAIL